MLALDIMSCASVMTILEVCIEPEKIQLFVDLNKNENRVPINSFVDQSSLFTPRYCNRRRPKALPF